MARIEDLRIDHPEEPLTRGRVWPRIAAVLVAAILLGIIGLSWLGVRSGPAGRPAALADRGAVTDSRERIAPTTAVSMSAGSFTAGGFVEIIPPGPTVVAARVEGWVRSVEVVEGQAVEAGQILLTLDDALHRQAMAEAEAEVALAEARLRRLRAGFRAEEIAEAEAQHRQAAARLAYARSQVERYERLVGIGAAPQRQLQAALAELAAAEAEAARGQALLDLRRSGQRPEDIAVAEAELAQAQTRLQRLRWQVEQCVIRAPAGGVVFERFVRVGDWVAPNLDRGGVGRAAAGGGALLSLFDPDRVQVWVEVNQREAGRVAVGQPVIMRADALRDRTIHGRVSRLMPRANLQRNTVEVKIALTDADGRPATPSGLRPDMSVQVTFLPFADGGDPQEQD